jgi:hypothetical protein
MLFIFVLLSVFHFSCFANSPCNDGKNFLEGKIPPSNGRFRTFEYALNLLCARKAAVLVETGTARYGMGNCIGDGCSTAIFGEWVKIHGGVFFSVDINKQYLENAAQALGDTKNYVNFVHSDSIAFLQNFGHPIDFLYLDSFDYEFGNPGPSQEHHLKEIIAAYPWLNPNSIVMIDDCALPEGGKGRLVIQYLRERGWNVIYDSYQVILSRN